MSQVNFRSISAAIVLCLAMTFAPNLEAQQSFRDSIVQAQKLIRSGTRQILKDELHLDEQEQAAFWALYDEYDAELRKIGATYIDAVTEFVDLYQAGALTDDNADRLLDTYFDIQIAITQLRQCYLGEFREILSGVQVMRFYQLENKVRAEVNAALALAIPLADPS